MCCGAEKLAQLFVDAEEDFMEKIGMNFTIFLLFFGVSALEAFQTRNWIKAGFWLAIGIVFLMGDTLRKRA
jgi:hypothetical protein